MAWSVRAVTGDVTDHMIGLTEIGSRSVRSPLVSTSAPNVYAFSGASVRVIVTVSDCFAPEWISNELTGAPFEVTVPVVPGGACSATFHTVVAGSIERNVRTVESLPASRLQEIAGRLRSLGRFFGMSPLTIVGSRNSRYCT